MLVRERLKEQREPRGRHFDEVAHPVAQDVGTQLAGIDVVRQTRDLFEELALARDRLRERAAAVAERMAAPRLREALDQRIVLGLDEQHFHVGPGASQRSQVLRQRVERFAAAHVDAERDP